MPVPVAPAALVVLINPESLPVNPGTLRGTVKIPFDTVATPAATTPPAFAIVSWLCSSPSTLTVQLVVGPAAPLDALLPLMVMATLPMTDAGIEDVPTHLLPGALPVAARAGTPT